MKVREIAPLIEKSPSTTSKLRWRMAQRGSIKSFGAGFYGIVSAGNGENGTEGYTQ